MTTRNKRKLAALNKENCEEHPRSNLAQNSSAPRSQEDYITQISEEIEGRVTKRLSKEFSRTENRILGALARLDDFLMNSLLQGHSGTIPELPWNALSTNQGTNEDDSQNDPHPDAGLFHGQMTQNSGPEDGNDSVYSGSVPPAADNKHNGLHSEVPAMAILHIQPFHEGKIINTFCWKHLNREASNQKGKAICSFHS